MPELTEAQEVAIKRFLEESECSKVSYGRPWWSSEIKFPAILDRVTANTGTSSYTYSAVYGKTVPRPKSALERVSGPDFSLGLNFWGPRTY